MRIEVEARFDAQGNPRPTRVWLDGEPHPVTDIGRSWRDAQGQHVLVMVPPGQTLHLLLTPQGEWRLVPIFGGRNYG